MLSGRVRRIIAVTGVAAALVAAVSATSYASGGSPNPVNVLVKNGADAPVPVGGSVEVSNLPQTQAVTGEVSVSNLPATQEVAGTVTVGNLPETQNVSGTIGIDPARNTVQATGLPTKTLAERNFVPRLGDPNQFFILEDVAVGAYDTLRLYGDSSGNGDTLFELVVPAVDGYGWIVVDSFRASEGNSILAEAVGDRVWVRATYDGVFGFDTSIEIRLVGSDS